MTLTTDSGGSKRPARRVRRAPRAQTAAAPSSWLWLFANFGLSVAGAGCLLTAPPVRRRR